MRALILLIVSLGLVALIGACDSTSPSTDSGASVVTASAGLDEAVEAQRRLRVGKGDNIGSCDESCGGKSKSGSCWCDDLCAKYGDCCDDLAAACEADDPCFVGGCSSQLCTDDPGAMTICDYKPEYACFEQHSSCERQGDGECGWTPSDALAQCITDAQHVSEGGCPALSCELSCDYGLVTDAEGCDTCACVAPPAGPSCADSCGGKSKNGDCYCDELCDQYGDCCADRVEICESQPLCPPIAQPPHELCPGGVFQPNYHDDGCIYGFTCVQSAEPCYVGGCDGQLCGEVESLSSACDPKPEYACYQQAFATCERQADGACGWTQSDALLQCIEEASHTCPAVSCQGTCEYGFQVDAEGCDTCLCNAPPSACEGHCGGKADEGCWCDEFCAGYGDCCPGLAETCQ